MRLLAATNCMLIFGNAVFCLSCSFLGHTVDAKGLPLDPTKIAIVHTSFMMQIGLAQVTELLCRNCDLANYCRNFSICWATLFASLQSKQQNAAWQQLLRLAAKLQWVQPLIVYKQST